MALVKIITVFLISSVLLSTSPSVSGRSGLRSQHGIVGPEDSQKGFSILDNNCNVCHKKRNRRRVFTPKNMEGYKQAIYTQGFVKKRMPKGNSMRLTTKVQQELLTWISSTKIEHHGI